jgi:3-phenylpropionate/trans-cinnamate dioxygenase ferredoxin reductase component
VIEPSFVIVGAGLAGAQAAAALRKEGFGGRVILLGEERDAPYDRPPLTKDYLRGESGRAHLDVQPEAFYRDSGIDLRLGHTASALDLPGRAVILGDGSRVPFDRLLLTTGSRPRKPAIPGIDLPGVHMLRRVGDADALRAELGPGRRLVVIGGGWIGTEVAASARQLGTEVTLLMTGAMPLERPLGPVAAAVYRDLHVEHGVSLVTIPGVRAIEGHGRAEAVLADDGRRFEGDAVLFAVGAVPRTELAMAAGLLVDGGVIVDELLATSAPGVFAAGDIAAAWHPVLGTRIRLDHWAAAKFHGPAAARSMLGRGTPYERLPYFYSDQYDVSMESRGHAPAWDRVVVRGDLAARSFVMFWLLDGRVASAINVNTPGVGKPVDALIRSGRPVDERALADPGVPLESLVAA